MAVICNWTVKLFTIAYLAALFLFLADNLGWLGGDAGPLSRLFLAPLGLPWNRMLGSAPSQLLPWLVAGAPIVNILILMLICKVLDRPGRI